MNTHESHSNGCEQESQGEGGGEGEGEGEGEGDFRLMWNIHVELLKMVWNNIDVICNEFYSVADFRRQPPQEEDAQPGGGCSYCIPFGSYAPTLLA